MKKACSFINPLYSECSKESIKVEISPGSNCNIEGVLNLPRDYGKPLLTLYSCKFNPCTYSETFGEIIELESDQSPYFFSESLHQSSNNVYISAAGTSCPVYKCTLSFNLSFVSSCWFKNTTKHNSTENFESNFFPIIVPFIIIILFLVLGLILHFIQKKYNWLNFFRGLKKESQESYEDEESEIWENQQKIFIVYSDEHPLHKEAVLKFATFLQADHHCKVFLDLYDKEKIYVDPAEWLEKSLDSERIVIIWSPGTEERWKEPINYVGKCDMLVPVLKKMKDDIILHNDVSKYLIVYFDYAPNLTKQTLSKNIRSFILTKEMTQFLKVLSNVKVKSRKSTAKFSEQSHYKSAFEDVLKRMVSQGNEDANQHIKEEDTVSMS